MSNKEVKWVCARCGLEEGDKAAIMRSVEEYKFLFPDRKVTTNTIYEWCGMNGPSKKVRRVLLDHYKRIGHGKSSYYVN